jgi:transcription factor SPN1
MVEQNGYFTWPRGDFHKMLMRLCEKSKARANSRVNKGTTRQLTTTFRPQTSITTKSITHLITMEDLELPPGSPALQDTQEPEGLNDPQDPLAPSIDQEIHEPADPLAHPTSADIDDLPDAQDGDDDDNEEEIEADQTKDSDAESELEELDDQEFADFDPSALNIPDKPVAVDADNVGLLGVHKRKRTEEEERERKKKKKEGRREKAKKPKRVRAGGDDEDDFEGGPEIDGKRARRPKASGGEGGGRRAQPRARTPEDEENLTPEEREYQSHLPTIYLHDPLIR